MVRFPSKSLGCKEISDAMQKGSEFIAREALMDLPLRVALLHGATPRIVQPWSRLDRFLISSDWEEHFLDVSQSCFPRMGSDHVSILLDGGGLRKGSKFVLI